RRFLSWYCRPELLEDLQGDLNEYFDRNLKTKGPRRSRFIYILDVFKFFRSYTIRKPKFLDLFIQWIMIGSYIKTSGRSIVRNKLFSFINIIGMAVSMSVGLLMIAFISDLLDYDNFHEKKDRIYRVITADQRRDQPLMNLASTSVKGGKEIRESVAGLEELTLLRNGFGGDAAFGETILPVGGLWADPSFFKVFTFPLVQGDPVTALKEPYSLVLTEKSAAKLFGTTNALGKSVTLDTSHYVVTGIMKDIPKLSHIRFEALGSFSTLELKKPNDDGGFLNWESIYSNYVYVLLPENGTLESVQIALDKVSATENAAIQNRKITLSLQPLKDIALGRHLTNQIGTAMLPLVVWILGGLAFMVILSACFNYTNLSIARSLRRSREVGIRKVIGAVKSHILGQFISESVIIALLALAFSFLLFLFLRIQFVSLHRFVDDLVSLELSPKLISYFIAFALVVGVGAGFIPALFFSRINAIRVLKDASSLQLFRRVTLRKALIVLQYSFSLMFITATLIGYNQYKGFLTFDLGFTTENILNLRLNGTNGDLVVKELSELPEVKEISRSLIVTSLGSAIGSNMKYKRADDSASVWENHVDEHYLPLHQHVFLAGRNFNPKPEQAEETEAIVNEQLLQRFDIGERDPQKALAEVITIDKKKLTIVGVLKDFHYETVEEGIKPMVFRNTTDKTSGYINVKVFSTDWSSTRAAIEKAWRKVDKIHPLDATFYDEQLEQAYSQFSVMIKVIGFLAFLAVSIASMGLFGMVVFTTETRLKEISIRKVLGASEWILILLLSRGFLLLLTLASLVAIPATYLFFNNVVLNNFAYHVPIGITELLAGVTVVMVVAIVMIGSQTLKVARSNPAEVLKNE
ncbi:MAG TPA: ABC transporter permease, partial [Cyclobacteriaceae bacterium]|nr:ABC transporter permease [Cyclobacteriaceae bacterium]